MTTLDTWKKSSYSGGGDGNACIEIAVRSSRIAIRDSKGPSHGILSVPVPAFAAFVEDLKGEKGRPA